jgi:hypothetical protein
MVTTDPYEDGTLETRRDFTANDFRIARALDSLLISATSIKGATRSALKTLQPAFIPCDIS